MKQKPFKSRSFFLWILVFSSILFCLILTGFSEQPIQNNIENTPFPDTILAAKYLEEADSLFDLRELDVAIENIQKARTIFEKVQNWERHIEAIVSLAAAEMYTEDLQKSARYLDTATQKAEQYFPPNAPVFWNIYSRKGDLFLQISEIDSAKIYLEKAAEIIKPTQRWEDYAWTEISLSINYYYLSDFKSMEKSLDNVLAIATKFLSPQHEIFRSIYNLQAALYNEIGEFEKSLETGKNELEFILESRLISYEDSMDLAISYQNIGVFYSNIGEKKIALKQYALALEYYQKLNVDNLTIANLLLNIGTSSGSLNNPQETISTYKNALAILKDVKGEMLKKKSANAYITAYNNIGRLFLKSGNRNLDSAFYYFNLALPLSEKFDKNLDISYGSFGLYHKAVGNYDLAVAFFQKAIEANIGQHGKKHIRCDNFYRFMTESLLKEGKPKEALKSCQKGIQNQGEDFNTDDLFYNPPITTISDKLGYGKDLALKISALQRLNIDSSKYLIPTYETCKVAMELMDTLRSGYLTSESKVFLNAQRFPIFESSIKTALRIYQNTKEKTYLHEAYSFAEKSKALILLESLKDLEQNYTSDKPDLATFLEKQKKLKTNFTFYERKLFDQNQKGEKRNQTKIETWEKTLSELRVEEENIRFRLEMEYPDYYNLNYDLSLASVEDIQKQLSQHSDFDKTAFIEYFTGDSAIYTFFISKDDFQIFETSKNQILTEAISTFQNLQSTNPALFNSNDLANQYFQKYTESAHFLYQKLMSPIVAEKDVEKLIIVADGNLGYLSFEAFLIALPNSNEANYSASNLDYLIKKYQISYAYSGTLFLESLKKRESKAKKIYAGFAPVFRQNNRQIASERGCHEGQLGTLENSEKSVRTVHDFLAGDLYLNEQASKAQFIENAPNYRLLHLSTHACVDDYDPMFNKVYFADDFLPTYELYNLRLHADLVVLSACETGRGELVRGEGIMSLARGFMQAGCPSVITSLWNANDFSTSEIMIDFHKNLKEGHSKDAALRNAKLAYLEDSPSRLSPPYFWATFVGIGNMEAMELGGVWGTPFYWLGVLAIFFSLGISIYLFKRKR